MGLGMNPVYLDANATLPLKSQAKEAIIALMGKTGNPSSIHSFGRCLSFKIEEAREKIAFNLGIHPAQIIFTSSGTESNNQVLNYFSDKAVLVSSIEHSSVIDAIPQVVKIPVNSKGIIDLQWLKDHLRTAQCHLISVMYANNETGIIQPIEEISEIAKAYNIRVHTDAVQAFGKIQLDFKKLGVDYLTLSAHKIGGPQGIGALVVAETAPFKPLLKGGGQERRRRAGTENSLGIIGFGAAVESLDVEEWLNTHILRDFLEDELWSLTSDCLVIDRSTFRLPNTTLLKMPGVENHKQLIAFDLKGIAVSAGSACSSGKVEQSHVLKAMGVDTNDVIRVSLGPYTTKEEINFFIQTWRELYLNYKN